MDCSMPGPLVHHQLLDLTHTHVHWVGDAIQPLHPLLSPSPPTFNLSQHWRLFKWVSSSHQVAKVLELQLQHQSFQCIFLDHFKFMNTFLWPRTCSSLINFFCMYLKRMCNLLLCMIFYKMVSQVNWASVFFQFSSGDFKISCCIVNWPVTPFSSISFCFIHFWGFRC